LLLKAAGLADYNHLIDKAISDSRANCSDTGAIVQDACQRLAVLIGREILAIIPGVISTEVDARLSFDTAATINSARRLISLYQQLGIAKERILIKIAATWEGIEAARQLELEGIHCNLTLLFSFIQAVACAEAKVTLISPFVGRILDWHKAHTGRDSYPATEDPGVLSVSRIYRYYKEQGYNTVVMGASFRNTDQILALAGCDKLTISPALMTDLEQQQGSVLRQLGATHQSDSEPSIPEPRVTLNQAQFRWNLNDDAMATEKLAEGIRLFAQDQIKLENLMQQRMVSAG
jgi:transaldolase